VLLEHTFRIPLRYDIGPVAQAIDHQQSTIGNGEKRV